MVTDQGPNTNVDDPPYKCEKDIENPNRSRKFFKNPTTVEYNIPGEWLDCSECEYFLP